METGVRYVAVDKHTSTKQTDIETDIETHIEIELTPLSVENRPCPFEKFFLGSGLGLEFVDTKSKERTWLDILCVGH
jgi:hypothetical protein